MNLPTGNPLFEGVELNIMDVQILMENLTANKFNGYVAFEEKKKIIGGFFFSLGSIKSAFEVNDKAIFKLIKSPNLLNQLSLKKYSVSVYVLSPKMVDVLSFIYLYKPIDASQDVRKKDFKKFLSSLEVNSISGFAAISIPKDVYNVVLFHGKIVFDNFASEYGKILCQQEQIDLFLNEFPRDGAKITVFGEKGFELEDKELIARRDLEYEKELKVKLMKGLGVAADTIRIDEMFFKEWNVKTSLTIQAEMVLMDGSVSVVKCASGKNLAGNVSVPGPMMKKFNLSEGNLVNVKPVMQ